MSEARRCSLLGDRPLGAARDRVVNLFRTPVGQHCLVSVPGEAVIEVTNDAFWYGDQRWGSLIVYVDGHRVGSAPPRGKTTIAVPPGTHVIRVRQWWYRSPEVTSLLEPGVMRRLAGARPDGFAGFTRLLLHPLQALMLTSVDNR